MNPINKLSFLIKSDKAITKKYFKVLELKKKQKT